MSTIAMVASHPQSAKNKSVNRFFSIFFMKESLENNMLQHMDVDSTTDDESLWILELMRYNREASGLHWSVQLSVSSPLLLHLKPAFAKQMQG